MRRDFLKLCGLAGLGLAVPLRLPDVRAAVDELRTAGVVFEEYDFPGLKTEDGIATLPDGGSAAWFLDSEGNILNINSGM